MIKELNGGPRLFSSFGFRHSFVIRHSTFEESHFRFCETAYRFAQVTRKCSLQI
jgi:hypothetical protein